MPARRLLLAALCALPLVAAACGGSDEPEASGPGAAEFRRYACASCHSLDGSEKTGPTFKGLADSTVTLADGKQVKADAAYLERAITDPDTQVTKGYAPGLMASSIAGFDLDEKPEDVKALVEFIQSVK